jgi:hypothetical protein
MNKLIESYNLQIFNLQEAIEMYRYQQKNKKNTLRYKNDIKRYCSNAKWLKKEIEYYI